MRVWVFKRGINPEVNSNYAYFEDFRLERTRHLSNEINFLSQESWPERIRNWLIRAGIFSVTIFALSVVFMGFITALYLLPIWGSILFVYCLVQNKK